VERLSALGLRAGFGKSTHSFAFCKVADGADVVLCEGVRATDQVENWRTQILETMARRGGRFSARVCCGILGAFPFLSSAEVIGR